MIVTAAIVWWNERPEDIHRCLKGLANVADRVVAVDGAYARYPGATVKSPQEQIDALHQAAEEFGLELRTPGIERLWAGQVEKRTFLMREAAKDSDWILVTDMDYVIETNREKARAELQQALDDDIDVIEVKFVTPDDLSRSRWDKAATNWHVAESISEKYYPVIMRAYDNYKVENQHWWYSAIKNGNLIWMWGPKSDIKVSRLNTKYVVNHMTLFRTHEQVMASRAFCNDRKKIFSLTMQEDDIPGLPAPEFDYKSTDIS